MRVICSDCGRETALAAGYCTCGGIRIVADDMTPDLAQARFWPASPLIRSRIPGLSEVYLKYEGVHATGSFKDRIMRLAMEEVKCAGAPGAVVPSSGNAALAAASAGAAAGVLVLAIVPLGTAEERVAPVLARGATVIEAGSDPSEAYHCADLVAEAMGLAPVYSTFAAPLAEWACRMIGIETAGQIGTAIAAILAPISAGPVLAGTGHGVLQASGALPPLIAVQPEGCQPIARAFAEGRKSVEPWTDPVTTVATSIADRLAGYPQDGTYMLRLVRETGGVAVAVSDDEMRRAREALLRHDGLDVELSSTAALAWLLRGERCFDGRALCVLTASGSKHTYRGDNPRPAQAPHRRMAQEALAFIASSGVRARLA